MPKLPAVSGPEAVKAFAQAGFILDRVRGSHHILIKEGCPKHLAVPVHGKRAVKPGTLRSLISDAGLTVAEFVDLL
jgi:predicted RNA binding protein YcfA (HicA-like mRNA interferase family)